MAMSTYLRRGFLNHNFRTATHPKLDFLYAGLFTTDPTPENTGSEVSSTGTAYARIPIPVLDGSWSPPADVAEYMTCHNLLPITWDTPTSLWGTPSHWALLDQVTGGNLCYYGPIQGTLRLIDADDDPVSLAPQALNVSMGQAASDYLEAGWLNHTLRTATLAKPVNIYAGLHTDDPTDAGGLHEFSGTNYARAVIPVSNAAWTVPTTEGDAEKIMNAGVVAFPSPGSDWGTYNYMSFNDGAVGGNMLLSSQMEIARLVVNGDNPPTWLAGGIQIFAS